MNKEKIEISVNEEDVQNIINCYEKDIEYIKQLEQENQRLKEEINELELTIGLRQTRNLIHKFDKEYDEEDKRKNPNRDYAGIMPDAEEVYKRYYKQQEIINKAIDYIEENGDLLYLASKCSIIYRDNIEVVAICDRLENLLEILKGGD